MSVAGQRGPVMAAQRCGDGPAWIHRDDADRGRHDHDAVSGGQPSAQDAFAPANQTTEGRRDERERAEDRDRQRVFGRGQGTEPDEVPMSEDVLGILEQSEDALASGSSQSQIPAASRR